MIVSLLVARGTTADEPVSAYNVEYPAAERFSPPLEGFFDEVSRDMTRVGRKTVRHQPNGGYGLPVRDRIGDKNLLHLGADVGWYRVGDPVFAIADGVVRVSQQPTETPKKKTEKGSPPILHWGGVIAVEHRLPKFEFVTTVYGHLDTKLLVSKGDVVKAGQPIGTIGTTRVNGGYTPHLHFGVREGRMAEKGREFLPVMVNGDPSMLTIDDVGDKVMTLRGEDRLPDQFQITIGEKTFDLRRQNEVYEALLEILWHVQPIGFAIVGYGLSTDGWIDPVQFLRNHVAE